MEDKRMNEISKLDRLKEKLREYEEDLIITEKAKEDTKMDYMRKKELEEECAFDRREILNIRKEIKILELTGKVIK